MHETEEKAMRFICLREYDKKVLSNILTERIIDLDNIITSRRIPEKESHRTIRTLSDELDTALELRDIICKIPNCKEIIL